MNWLFICSKNRWRSLTAEKMFKNFPGYDIRSAGTDSDARIRITSKMLNWADHIFVMEPKHLELLKLQFGKDLFKKQVTVLNIPDEYQLDDPELKTILREMMSHYLQ